MSEAYDCRIAFAKALEELGSSDPRVVVVVNDSVSSSNVGGFKKQFPDRLVNVGIAEQDLIGIGAGLANGARSPSSVGHRRFSPGGRSSRLRRTWRTPGRM